MADISSCDKESVVAYKQGDERCASPGCAYSFCRPMLVNHVLPERFTPDSFACHVHFRFSGWCVSSAAEGVKMNVKITGLFSKHRTEMRCIP